LAKCEVIIGDDELYTSECFDEESSKGGWVGMGGGVNNWVGSLAANEDGVFVVGDFHQTVLGEG
jgi:hypothetical protein